MSAATLALIIQGILAAVQSAPQVIAVIEAAKAFITSLFGAKLISAEVQKALHEYVDAHAALAAAGVTPPAWRVDPDPS